jgi:hypothetical protein
VGYLVAVADPAAADAKAARQQQRGLWVSPTLDGMVAVDGLLDPEAGETLLTALEPLPVALSHTSDPTMPPPGCAPPA